MTIRPLILAEVGRCLPFGEAFYAEVPVLHECASFNSDAFLRFWTNAYVSGQGVIIGTFDGEVLTGVLGWIYFIDPTSGDLCAAENFWYLPPQYRRGRTAVSLLKEYMKLAAEAGAKRTLMVHLDSIQAEGLHKLYTRLGFKPFELIYQKVNA